MYIYIYIYVCVYVYVYIYIITYYHITLNRFTSYRLTTLYIHVIVFCSLIICIYLVETYNDKHCVYV